MTTANEHLKMKKGYKMGKYKITDEMLQDIEAYAEDEYSLEDMFDELNISKTLMKNEKIQEAFERGLEKNYLVYAADGMSDKDIVDEFEITAEQCLLWGAKHSEAIKEAKQKIERDKSHATKQFSDPLYSGMVNIIKQNGNSDTIISQKVLGDDIQAIVKKVKNGNADDLITMLTTNILQLQLFNGTVTQNLMGDAGKQLDSFEKLSSMQIKVMQETRKSIMAINEITNPKRTTFIKEANQHNHLHQENSQKKLENENELQKTEQLEVPAVVTDAEIIPLKDKVK